MKEWGLLVYAAIQNVMSHLAFMRYSARLMLAGVPVMVTRRSVDPSTGFAILIWAPDICLISLIFAPWRPMMHPISCDGESAVSSKDG